MKNKLYAVETEKPVGCGYHYCIKNGCMPYIAFRNKTAFDKWLSNFKLITTLSREGDDYHTGTDSGGKYKVYSIIGSLDDRLFKSMDEIPEGAKCIKDLSNGSIVDCYIADVNGIMTIFRPNPNYKDIYKPLSLDEHIKYSLENM